MEEHQRVQKSISDLEALLHQRQTEEQLILNELKLLDGNLTVLLKSTESEMTAMVEKRIEAATCLFLTQ